MANPIRKIETLAGTTVYQVDGRKYGARPARPQFRTREQAETALAEMIAKRGGGLHPDRRSVTFEMQADAYLKNNKDTLAAKTLRSYKSAIKAQIAPKFGTRRIVDIRTADINAFLTEKRGGDPPLSLATIRYLRAMLSIIFGSAVDDGLISANPVAAARSATRGRKARAAANEAVPKERPFTQAQQDDLLEWCGARDRELGDFLFTLLRSGCRPGEARALRWGDIIGDKLLIERSADDRNVITPTKTGNKRAVDISPALNDVLRLRLLKRPAATQTDYIFGNGEPIPVRTLARRFELALKECKITGHVMYDCRHTFASTLLARSRDVVYAAKMLGHSDPGTTLKHYAHFMEAESAHYVDLLDGAPATEREREEMKAST